MALDVEHFKQLLLAKQKEVEDEIAGSEENAREIPVTEVGDESDRAISDEGKAVALEIGSRATDMFEDVRAALDRIERGEYGVCEDCGRPIEEKRLEAVPWARYCLQDQEKHDRENAVSVPSDTL